MFHRIIESTQPRMYRRRFENFLLVWLDPKLSEVDNGNLYSDTLIQFQRFIKTIHLFSDADQCANFLTDSHNEKIILIISSNIYLRIVPLIHDLYQLDSIYLLCEKESDCDDMLKESSKVRGAFSNMTLMAKAFIQSTQKEEEQSQSLSFITIIDDTLHRNIDELDQSFMYTQLIKEILLETKFDNKLIENFIKYYHDHYIRQHENSDSIDKFQREYHLHSPIWWYTSPTFIYSLVNHALRTQDIEILIKMGFYIRDLHLHLQQLHTEQITTQFTKPFTVYRGQGISKKDFDTLVKTKGGIMAFNNFLSTSIDYDISLAFAVSNKSNPDLFGILFEISVNPDESSTPFAHLNGVSYYKDLEDEILFSMHTVFRIEAIENLDDSGRLWQVHLKLTSDNDEFLQALTERMRHETRGSSSWARLGQLLIKLSHFDKAEEVYQMLLTQEHVRDIDKAHIYHQLGLVKDSTGNYKTALLFYEKALEINLSFLPSKHPDIAASYHNIGLVNYHMGEFSKALDFYHRDLAISKEIYTENDPNLASCYNSIGAVYDEMSEYSRALSFYQKALEIKQKSLPPTHPSLSTAYNNIGLMYDNLGQYPKALTFYSTALNIRLKSLPPDHPDLATSYNNMGLLYNNMGEYSKVLPCYERALEIKKKHLPANHPSFIISYNNIGSAQKNMGENIHAISSYEQALQICVEVRSPNHPDFALTYNNIGSVHENMNNYSQALVFYEKALKIREESLPNNHIDFGYSYFNIGRLYNKMGEYSKSLSYCQKALEVFRCALSENHPHLRTIEDSVNMLKKKLSNP